VDLGAGRGRASMSALGDPRRKSRMERDRKEAFAEGLAAAALVLAPLALGMVHLPVVLAISGLAWLALGLLVIARGPKPLRIGWFGAALLGLAFATALHLVPLPFGLVRLLSPETARINEIALGPAPGPRPLSLDLPATWTALVKALGLAAAAAPLHHLLSRAPPCAPLRRRHHDRRGPARALPLRPRRAADLPRPLHLPKLALLPHLLRQCQSPGGISVPGRARRPGHGGARTLVEVAGFGPDDLPGRRRGRRPLRLARWISGAARRALRLRNARLDPENSGEGGILEELADLRRGDRPRHLPRGLDLRGVPAHPAGDRDAAFDRARKRGGQGRGRADRLGSGEGPLADRDRPWRLRIRRHPLPDPALPQRLVHPRGKRGAAGPRRAGFSAGRDARPLLRPRLDRRGPARPALARRGRGSGGHLRPRLAEPGGLRLAGRLRPRLRRPPRRPRRQ